MQRDGSPRPSVCQMTGIIKCKKVKKRPYSLPPLLGTGSNQKDPSQQINMTEKLLNAGCKVSNQTNMYGKFTRILTKS